MLAVEKETSNEGIKPPKPQARMTKSAPKNHPAATPVRSARLFLLLTFYQWLLAVIVGLGAVGVFLPYYRYISPWIGLAVFLMGVTIVHLRYSCRFIVPFPHIVLLVALLQYVLAAWISIQYPSVDPTYNIGLRLPEYLGYGTLVVAACVVGWGIGLVKLRPSVRVSIRPNPELLRDLDRLILLGFIGVALSRLIHTAGLNFVLLLLASLRYVGVFGRMLCRGPGWGWRIALILAVEVLFATSSAMFGDIVLWSLWIFAIWVYVYTPTWRVMLPAFAMAFLLLLPLQQSKWQLRQYLGDDEFNAASAEVSALTKSELWLSFLGRSALATAEGNLDPEFLGDTVMRYNQGWIINRVMQYVPDVQPYARGETIKAAFLSALMPRFLMPNKVLAGGQLYMEKYAGMLLNERTSMNLGYAGEMYANYGYVGGIIGCGVYALFFSLLFRWVCLRAFNSPLWWSVLPYIGFTVLKADDGVVEVLNWTVKAAIVMTAVCYAFPAFRRALFFPEGGGQGAKIRNQKSEIRRRRAGRVMGAPAKP